ncbi:MAG: DNA translocase FtsK [Lachnospiraceae bacterium]|nr:DNA translocase FtsK [Lachnospiraceae bacterium]
MHEIRFDNEAGKESSKNSLKSVPAKKSNTRPLETKEEPKSKESKRTSPKDKPEDDRNHEKIEDFEEEEFDFSKQIEKQSLEQLREREKPKSEEPEAIERVDEVADFSEDDSDEISLLAAYGAGAEPEIAEDDQENDGVTSFHFIGIKDDESDTDAGETDWEGKESATGESEIVFESEERDSKEAKIIQKTELHGKDELKSIQRLEIQEVDEPKFVQRSETLNEDEIKTSIRAEEELEPEELYSYPKISIKEREDEVTSASPADLSLAAMEADLAIRKIEGEHMIMDEYELLHPKPIKPQKNDLYFNKALMAEKPDFSDEDGEKIKSREQDGFVRRERKSVASLHSNERRNSTNSSDIAYQMPPIDLLKEGESKDSEKRESLNETAEKLRETLEIFGVKVTMTDIISGPTATRYEMKPDKGVKVSKILGLTDDIRLNLAAANIRIEAPIPGKDAVGIEIPNKEVEVVALRELIESDAFKNSKSKLTFAVGKNIGGEVVVFDIAKMPHLLIAGATGSGKSVCINTIIMSILYKARPDEVKMIMIDPKIVELSVYNGLPHLLTPVVTDTSKAAGALKWGVMEMMKRYKLFAAAKVKDMKGYNAKIRSMRSAGDLTFDDGSERKELPQILIIVDELADLMMAAKAEIESSIMRLTQLARAAGIHLIIATQRPSVDVITGVIKSNMPSRIAFAVSSGVDSRTILDMAGAERLLGRGDMLFYPAGKMRPERVQGAYVDEETEIEPVVDFISRQYADIVMDESDDITDEIEAAAESGNTKEGSSQNSAGSPEERAPREERDQLFAEAGRLILERKKASIGMLQRVFKTGFNRAARIMDQLAEAGVVSGEDGTKSRNILMSRAEFEDFLSGKEVDVESRKAEANEAAQALEEADRMIGLRLSEQSERNSAAFDVDYD